MLPSYAHTVCTYSQGNLYQNNRVVILELLVEVCLDVMLRAIQVQSQLVL
jgi:hypothetical protein